jgi:hypothetical protein
MWHLQRFLLALLHSKSLSCAYVLVVEHLSNDLWRLPLYICWTGVYTCHLLHARPCPTPRMGKCRKALTKYSDPLIAIVSRGYHLLI